MYALAKQEKKMLEVNEQLKYLEIAITARLRIKLYDHPSNNLYFMNEYLNPQLCANYSMYY